MLKGNIHFDTVVDETKSVYDFDTDFANNYAQKLIHMRVNEIKAIITIPNVTSFNNTFSVKDSGIYGNITIPVGSYTKTSFGNTLVALLNVAAHLTGVYTLVHVNAVTFTISCTINYHIDLSTNPYGTPESKYMYNPVKVSATSYTFYNCLMYHTKRLYFKMKGIGDKSMLNDSYNVGTIINNDVVYVHHIKNPTQDKLSIDTSQDITTYTQKDLVFPNPMLDIHVTFTITDEYGRIISSYFVDGVGIPNNDSVYIKFDMFQEVN